MANLDRIEKLLGLYKEIHAVDKERGLNAVQQRISTKKRRKLAIRLAWAVASCVVLCIGVMALMDKNEASYSTSNSVILRQASGVFVDLMSVEQGEQIEGGIVTAKNEIRFNDVTVHSESQMAEITTPLGAEYKIVLSDGTLVWMNSCSSIRFTNNFAQ